jgi:hypothetical protein
MSRQREAISPSESFPARPHRPKSSFASSETLLRIKAGAIHTTMMRRARLRLSWQPLIPVLIRFSPQELSIQSRV